MPIERGSTPEVWIENVYLGGSLSYEWDLVDGVQPYETTYLVTKPRADALAQYVGKEVTLTFKAGNVDLSAYASGDEAGTAGSGTRTRSSTPGTGDLSPASAGKERSYKVWLLEILAGDDPYTRRLRLADFRWLWPKRWVSSVLNLRRATGEKIAVGADRVENAVLADRLKYAEFSLYPPSNPERLWEAVDALEYYVTTDEAAEPDRETATPYEIEIVWLDLPDASQQQEIQSLQLEGPLDNVIAQIFQYIPGFTGFADPDGKYVIKDTRSGDEKELLEGLPPERVGDGQVLITDKRGLRPSKIVVMFTPEIELRFDYTENSGTQSVTRNEDTPVLYNVAPSPDFLTGGPQSGQPDDSTPFAIYEGGGIENITAARGSFITMDDLFEAWGSFGFFNQAVSFDALRKHATKYGFASFLQAWGNHPYEPFDGAKMARAQAAANNWRRTFQIDRIFMQRLLSINNYRVSLLVPHLGVYAPSPVYCDWTRRPSYKGFATGGDPNDAQGFRVRGYSDTLDSLPPAPVRVQMIDPEAGLFIVEPQPDPWGYTDNIWLGYPEEGFIPSQDVGKAKAEAQMIYRHWFLVTLEGGWKMSTIMTVVPGSPNTIKRLYHREVKPDDVADDLGTCTGPVVYARVLPGVMTARFGWKDGATGNQLIGAVKGTNDLPEDAIVNEPWIDAVAKAVAARIYDALADRPQGSLSVDWDPMLEPAGSIGRVRNTMRRGEMSSMMEFPAVTQLNSIWRWLDMSTRRVILQFMQQGGGSAK